MRVAHIVIAWKFMVNHRFTLAGQTGWAYTPRDFVKREGQNLPAADEQGYYVRRNR